MEKSDNQRLEIFFKPGLISLDDLYSIRLKKKQKFSVSEIKYIFKFCIDFVLLMRKYGFVHNDIKPENLTLVIEDFNDKKKKSLRFIDLGLANDHLQTAGFTVRYFMSPLRKYQKDGEILTPVFANFDEKFKNEIFTVFRTLQDLMILDANDRRIVKHFLLPGLDNNPPLSMNDILVVQDIIEKEYYAEELK